MVARGVRKRRLKPGYLRVDRYLGRSVRPYERSRCIRRVCAAAASHGAAKLFSTDLAITDFVPADIAARLMPMTHAPETGARNRRQKTGVGFWRRFFTPVAKFLAPETNTDE